MSPSEQLEFQPETFLDNVVSIMGRGGFGGEGSLGQTPFPPGSTESVAKPQEQEQSSTDRKRNIAWDAAEEALGYGPKTDSEKALWGKMTGSLNRAGATADQISAVAEWYHRHWPGIDLTITALEKWFSHFLAKAEKRATAKANSNVCPSCEMGGGLHAADCETVK